MNMATSRVETGAPWPRTAADSGGRPDRLGGRVDAVVDGGHPEGLLPEDRRRFRRRLVDLDRTAVEKTQERSDDERVPLTARTPTQVGKCHGNGRRGPIRAIGRDG